MKYLLDTVVLSETRKSRADANVVQWIASVAPEDLFVSVVSLYEIQRGIVLAERRQPEFAQLLTQWLAALPAIYADRIMPVDSAVARRWGRLSGALGHVAADLAIAATALEHGMVVATRNTDDFVRAGVPVLNPFQPNPTAVPPRL